ncbi:MAG: DUF547 domain-containing protein, partial [Nitrospinota bacterium]
LRRFSESDPRKALVVTAVDPRIHFALVCASNSCPPITFYDAARLDDQLNVAARSFFNRGGIEIDKPSGVVGLSSIFKWYKPDFGGTEEKVLESITPYLKGEYRGFLKTNKNLTVRYLSYDWNLNRSIS